MTRREQIEERLGEDSEVLFADGYDDAIIGTVRRFNLEVVAYDYEKVIQILEKDMSREEAEEFFEFNIVGAWCGEGTPAFVMRLEEET